MVFGLLKGLFGRKKSTLQLRPKQEVEIEFEGAEAYHSYFVQVLEVQRNRITLKAPGTERRPVHLSTGQTLTVTAISGDTLHWFDAQVIEARAREFDITVPRQTGEQPLPPADENCRIEVAIPVEYRAMNTAHTQVAQTHWLTPTGMALITNLPIPSATSLLLELEIPNARDIKCKGKAVQSERHPEDSRKHLTEIEFEDIPRRDVEAILRYAVFLRRRGERQQERGETDA